VHTSLSSGRYQLVAKVALALSCAFMASSAWTPAQASSTTTAEQPYVISSSLPLNIQSFLRMETDLNVFRIDHLYGTLTSMAKDGAYMGNPSNGKGAWEVENQRYGSVDVEYGILHYGGMPGSKKILLTGLKVFDYAFRREAKNGSFPDCDGLFHGTAMFLSAAGPALILLKYWPKLHVLGKKGVKHLNWEIGKAKKAAHYLIKTWWKSTKHIDDSGKEERFFEAANALESVGILAGDTKLGKDAKVYAKNGAAMTEPNGIWTEHGLGKRCCHDSSYQALGLINGLEYITLSDLDSSSKAYQAVQRGEKWEYSRTRPDGTVNQSGDDRTGPNCPEKNSAGQCKTLDIVAVKDAIMRWGVLSGDQAFIRRAYYISLRACIERKMCVLPTPGLNDRGVSLTVKQADDGAPVWLSGAGFQPYEGITISFDGATIGTVTTDEKGTFGDIKGVWTSAIPPLKVELPSSTTPGTYSFTATGDYGTTERLAITITSS
jgi:hypothetical protein